MRVPGAADSGGPMSSSGTDTVLRSDIRLLGIIEGVPMLDLCYDEDAMADVDMNLVMTGGGDLVEIQGTAEHHPFSTDQLSAMLDLGRQGVNQLIDLQKQVLERDQARS